MLSQVLKEKYAWVMKSLSTLCNWLRRMRIRCKRARAHIHSTDAAYSVKYNRIRTLQSTQHSNAEQHSNAQCDSETHDVLLYLDEVSYARQPTVAKAYAEQGKTQQPRAERSHAGERTWRILGALNGQTGAVTYLQRAHITVATLRIFFGQVVMQYPEATTIYLVVDNWPVHYHPDLLVALVPQPYAKEFVRPGNWPTQATRKAPTTLWPIVLVPLPTYASWLNPIEKLWRKTRQELLHLHTQADDWIGLRTSVATFLDQFHAGSQELLHYTGLLPK